jgi:putative PIN family toxin of toxin-antitoxin system
VIRAVFDTNVLTSGFVFGESVPGELLRRWLAERFELVTSDHIAGELRRALTKPYFAARFTSAQARQALDILTRQATVVAITAEVAGVATHPEDDPVLATAVSEQGTDGIYLVTGDAQLRKLGTYQRVVILTPREFLSLLERADDQSAASRPPSST